MSTNGDGPPPKVPGREAPRPLPRRFYKHATTGQADARGRVPVLLDGKPARTPRQRALALPGSALAEAVAAEWEAQHRHVDPASMPLTRLLNTVLDGVEGREGEVRDHIVRFAGSDLLCYRADAPDGLVARQRAAWDPVLAWADAALGIRLALSHGVMHIAQSGHALDRVRQELAGLDAFRLAAVHTMVTLTGSAILGLAVLHGRLSPDAAWTAAHVDEDWQIAQWGEDAEAMARRRRRRAEMQSAADLLRLLL